jgi:hypothetical protein
MVVQANIFRNSVKIASVRREIFFVVITCANQYPILSTADKSYYKTICLGKSPNGTNVVDFYFTSADSDANDTVSISCNSTINGAVWTDNNGKSKRPEGHFHWEANAQNATLSTYSFTVTLTDNGCPMNRTKSTIIRIYVLKNPEIKHKVTSLGCGEYQFSIDSSYGKTFTTDLWIAGKWQTLPITQSYQIEKPGVYPYIVKIAVPGYCDYYDTSFIITDTFVVTKFLPDDTSICYGSSKNYNIKLPAYIGSCKYNWSTGDTINSLQTGPLYANTFITLTITDANGCSKLDSTRITIIPNPTITQNKNVQMCEKSFVYLYPTVNCYGVNNRINKYLWSKVGDPAFSDNTNATYATEPGIYYLKVTDNYKCLASDSARVFVNPIDTAISAKGPNITVAPNMQTYDWYKDGSLVFTGNSNIYTVLLPGWYHAVVTDSINCNIKTRSVYMSLSGINQSDGYSAFRLYPNPTNGKLMLEAGIPLNDEVRVKVFNALGKEMLNKTVSVTDIQSGKEIDISDQPAGTYSIIIRYQNTAFHQLIIKE